MGCPGDIVTICDCQTSGLYGRLWKLRQLTETEREELTRWSRSRTLAARDVFVASLILALADGKSYTQIERDLNA